MEGMIRGERVIDYDEGEIDPEQGQCCLRAGHLAVSCASLAVLSGAAVVASFCDEQFLLLRTPAAAILGLAIFLTFVTSFVAFFVECRLQERSSCCRGLYFVTCHFCIDDIDRMDLEEKLRKRKEGYDNVGLAGSRSNSPEKNAADIIFAPPTTTDVLLEDKSLPASAV